MECKYCIDDLNFNIKIAGIKTKCKYHRKKWQVYPAQALAPKGICRELFYAAYPTSLAVLYNGVPVRWRLRKKGIEEMVVSCPAPDGVEVITRAKEILPPPIRILKEFVEEVLKRVYRGYDAPFRKVVLEVIKTSPHCPKGYKIGDNFLFNIDKKDELCPAGFAAVYPYLRSLKEPIFVHCPDYVGVTYEVTAK